MPRSNQNLSKDEAAILRGIAAYHGYEASSGPHTGQGSAFALQLAVIHGDVQTVSLEPEELAIVVPWLRQQAEALPEGALQEALMGLADQLARRMAERGI